MAKGLTRPSWADDVHNEQDAAPHEPPRQSPPAGIDRLLRLPQVVEIIGKRRSAIYVDIATGIFPHPVSLGKRCSAWPQSEVVEIVAARIRGASVPQLRALVAALEAKRKTPTTEAA